MILLNSQPLVLNKELAVILGLNEALILQQVHYWIEINKGKGRNFHEGRYWTYNTIDEWQKEFPFWSNSTIKRAFKRLREMNLIWVDNFNVYQMDRTLWYTIDYEELDKLISHLGQSDRTTGSNRQKYRVQYEPKEEADMTAPLPETSTEITSEISNPSINHDIANNDDGTMDGKNIAYDKLNARYRKILHACEIGAIDERYRGAISHAIKLLILDIEKGSRIKLGDNYVPVQVVEKDMGKLNFFTIQHAVNKFKEISGRRRIRNPVAYLKVLIYNSINELEIDMDSSLRREGLID